MNNFHPVPAAPVPVADAAHPHSFAPLVFKRWHNDSSAHLGLTEASPQKQQALAPQTPAPAGSGASLPAPAVVGAATGLRGLQAWHRSMVKAGRISDRGGDAPIGGRRS